jgi:superfamily II DNA/RNA helicase
LVELESRRGQILVFVKSKHLADKLAKQLKQYGVKANALHGDLRQNRRRQVMEFFREGSVPVLVATDVAARGLDIDGMSCVINYDLPQCAEDYIHRIGRTGRAGSIGTALSFVLEEDDSKWKEICRVCHLGKITELTKTSRPLPKPKFVPENIRKKITRTPPQVKHEKQQTPASKKTIKPIQAPAAKKVLPPTPPAPAAETTGFRIIKVGSKKTAQAVQLTSFHKHAKSGKPFFRKKKKHRR